QPIYSEPRLPVAVAGKPARALMKRFFVEPLARRDSFITLCLVQDRHDLRICDTKEAFLGSPSPSGPPDEISGSAPMRMRQPDASYIDEVEECGFGRFRS